MNPKLLSRTRCGLSGLVVALGISLIATSPHVCAQSTVYNTTLGEANPVTPEINSEELEKILADHSGSVLDVRFPQEYAIAHIPGSINIYERRSKRSLSAFLT